MSVPQSVADVIDRLVTCGLESLDRMDLNVNEPWLQTGGSLSNFANSSTNPQPENLTQQKHLLKTKSPMRECYSPEWADWLH
jgi:hypothetical protein